MVIIETDRLILRQWVDADKPGFAALNGDPETMRFFPKTLTADQSDELADKMRDSITEDGYGFMAVELKASREFIGTIGLARPHFQAHFTPCTEIGWRLHRDFWGKGYATEGARAMLNFAFEEVELSEIVAFTSPLNIPSIRVMQRLGMVSDPREDFDHPRVKPGHPLERHVLYRRAISKPPTLSKLSTQNRECSSYSSFEH